MTYFKRVLAGALAVLLWLTAAPAFASVILGASGIHVIGLSLDGGGIAIVTGDVGVFPSANYTCTINKAMISGSPSGSITIDVWKKNAAIPTSADKISASAPVTLSSSQLNQASSLSGWTLSVSPNDVFGFTVATAATVQKVTVQLWCQ